MNAPLTKLEAVRCFRFDDVSAHCGESHDRALPRKTASSPLLFVLRFGGEFALNCQPPKKWIARLDPWLPAPYSRFDLSACIASVGSVFSLRVCSRDLPLVVACTPASREAQFGHVEPTYLKVGAQTSRPRLGGGQEVSQLPQPAGLFFLAPQIGAACWRSALADCVTGCVSRPSVLGLAERAARRSCRS